CRRGLSGDPTAPAARPRRHGIVHAGGGRGLQCRHHGMGVRPRRTQSLRRTHHAQRARPLPRMSDVFVSYSRRDADFVHRLVDALTAHGLTAWVDEKGIPPSAEWMREILGAIESADCFVYVVTPEAAASEVCALELQHAFENNKRILPVLRRPVAEGVLAPELARLQWVDFRDDVAVEAAVVPLVAAVRTAPDFPPPHPRRLTRAVRWRDNRRDASLLLRGKELEAAERWLGTPEASPEPTELQREFIRASRLA